MMHVVVVGMNHQTAPVALRERLAVDEVQLRAFLADLPKRQPPMAETVILSTCNRFEAYLLLDDTANALSAFRQLSRIVAKSTVVDWTDHLYVRSNEEAVRHLFRVAAGLDSMILGEPQILGQVNQAYALAHEAGAAGPILSRLFQRATRVGKRVRTETAISRASSSVGSAAVRLLQQEFPDLPQRRALVVGAGQMGLTVARYLASQGVHDIAIVNRTLDRAEHVAAEVKGSAYAWQALLPLLTWADVAIFATGAMTHLLSAYQMRLSVSRSKSRPLTLVDIGVPRNVHPDVANVPHVRLFDIDDLHDIIEAGMDVRRQAVPQVEAIIAGAVDAFGKWQRSRDVARTISALYEQAELIRQNALRQTLRHHADGKLTPEVLDMVTRSLMDKLLQTPAQRLQELAIEGQAHPFELALQEMFNLPHLEE